jgi:DNA-binding MarR family transcriptional regulator
LHILAAMPSLPKDSQAFRVYRNSRLYRSLARTLRVYNRRLVSQLQARGFDDFSPAFPPLLSNLDMDGTRIGVLAQRAGVTRQAAGQLLAAIERCGYVERLEVASDARATLVRFTARGRRLLATVIALVETIEGEFAVALEPGEFDRVRDGLFRIADRIDPGGALGVGDRGGPDDAEQGSSSHSRRSPAARRRSAEPANRRRRGLS